MPRRAGGERRASGASPDGVASGARAVTRRPGIRSGSKSRRRASDAPSRRRTCIKVTSPRAMPRSTKSRTTSRSASCDRTRSADVPGVTRETASSRKARSIPVSRSSYARPSTPAPATAPHDRRHEQASDQCPEGSSRRGRCGPAAHQVPDVRPIGAGHPGHRQGVHDAYGAALLKVLQPDLAGRGTHGGVVEPDGQRGRRQHRACRGERGLCHRGSFDRRGAARLSRVGQDRDRGLIHSC